MRPVAFGEALPAVTRLTLFSDDQAAYAFFQRFDPEVRVVLSNLPSRETTNSQEASAVRFGLLVERSHSPPKAGEDQQMCKIALVLINLL